MDRLTFEGDFCTIAMCQHQVCPYDGACDQKKTWERLKEYEDIMPLDRVRELAQADKDGRLAVHGRWVSGPSDVLGMDCEFCSVCGQGMKEV